MSTKQKQANGAKAPIHTARAILGGGKSTSANEFFVATQDVKGHSARCEFRVIPALKRNIRVMLENHGLDTGWETESDFLRWATLRGVSEIADRFKNGELDNYQRQVAAIHKVLAMQAQMLKFQQTMIDTEKYVREMETVGAREPARVMLLELAKAIGAMTDSTWKKIWMGDFKVRFKPFLKGASLRPEAFTDEEE
jgi:hypothetical protein